jgi:hypothetical protein
MKAEEARNRAAKSYLSIERVYKEIEWYSNGGFNGFSDHRLSKEVMILLEEEGYVVRSFLDDQNIPSYSISW